MPWYFSDSGSAAVQRAMAGLYILAAKSRRGMLAFRMDWDSLPEKSQRFGEDVELAEMTVGSTVCCDPSACSGSVDIGIRLPNG